ncbi:hypothetical protein BTJ39_22555 [Izhakiella australiensis]|uniref:Flagellar hook-length control protein-like C-terminal domain-containing protein n=1 Tax=Izhakiella australiensis TaxID=1926881 RepID=A0A1S8Y8X5_9GAMM|nr:flagellar hook-length control protein FliK [Izhakiella australiensis]OON35569.1 hypothetical protein BTJ39_22555 [Izhakiella australiensis]
MITMPMVTTTSSSNTSSTVVSGDTATADQSLLAADGAAQDPNAAPAFFQMLGDRLVSLVKNQSAGGKSAAAQADAAQTAADAKDAVNADLNKLLAQLDKPEALSTLLQTKAATDNDKTSAQTADAPQSALSSNDMQALQALFAMLPHNVQQPAETLNKNDGDLADSIATGAKGGKSTTLSALLSSATTKESDSGAVKADSKVGSDLATGASGKSAAVSPQSGEVKNAAFEQVLNSVKAADKENSSSGQNATISNAVMSAASATQTPTQTTQVTAPPTAQLSAQLGSQEWQQHLGQQVLMFSRNGQHSAELHLHPEDLGSIQISLQLHNDQANLNMVSSHSQVRAALEAAIPHLRHALAESGINLGQSNVSSDAFQQGQSFAGQQEQRNNNRGNTFSLTQDNDSDAVAIAVPASLQSRAGGTSAVDIFA